MKLLVAFVVFGFCVAHAQSGREILKNGDFEDGLLNWNISITKEYREVGTKPPAVRQGPGGPEVFISVGNKSAAHYINIHQSVDITPEKVYRFAIDVKIQGEGMGRITLFNPETRKNCGLGMNIPADRTWKRYETYFVGKDLPESEPPKLFICFAGQAGLMAVRKASLTLSDKAEVSKTDRKTVVVSEDESAPVVDMETLAAEFAADSSAAMEKYKGKSINLSAPLVAVGPGPSAGTWLFTLEFGKAKLVGQQSEFNESQVQALAGTLKEASGRFAAMKRSPKWASFPPDVKKGHALDTFPSIDATGWISTYRDGVILIGRAQDLVITTP